MNMIASQWQLRASLVRWALFLVPLVILLGILSGRLAGSGSDSLWFAALDLPAFYPPSWLFGVIWPILYLLMGFALAIVAAARGARGRGAAVLMFVIQLTLNLAWSATFFAAHQLTGALVLIAVLDLALIATIVLFWRVRRSAAVLLLPYLAWTLFASWLAFAIQQANPGLDGREYPGVLRYEF